MARRGNRPVAFLSRDSAFSSRSAWFRPFVLRTAEGELIKRFETADAAVTDAAKLGYHVIREI